MKSQGNPTVPGNDPPELHWTRLGIVEIAVRNQSVADYMNHWESRATKAENQVQILRDALESVMEVFHRVHSLKARKLAAEKARSALRQIVAEVTER